MTTESNPHSDRQGQPGGRAGDTPARRDSDNTLRASIEELEAIHASAPAAMLLLDPDRRVRRANALAARLAGRQEREMAGLLPGEALRCLHHLDDPRGCGAGPACATCAVRSAMLDTLATGASHEEVEAYSPPDTGLPERWLSISTAPAMLGGQRHAVAWALDVTARKQAEADSAVQANRLEAMIESTEDPIFSVDREYRYTAFNTGHALAMKALFNRDIAVGANILDYHLSAEDRRVAQANLDKALRGEPVSAEYYCGDDAFERRHFVIKHTPIRGADGAVKGVAVFACNITEQKRLEESLRENAGRLTQAVKAGHVGLWDWDMTADKVSYSAEWKRQIGYEEDEISDDFNEWEGRLHPDDREPITRKVREFIAAPWSGYETEFRFRHKDGSYRWILAQADLLYGPDGKPVRMLGSHVDITERKQAEDAARAAAQALRSMVNSITESAFLLDLDGTVVLSNATTASRLGVRVEDLVGRKIFEFLPADIISRRREILSTVAASGRPARFVDTRFGRDFASSIYPVTDEAGRVVHLAVFAYDVTELNQANEAIRQSEARYRALVENVDLGISLIGTDHHVLSVNAAQARLSRRDRQKLVGQECFRVFRGLEDICPDCPGAAAMASGAPTEVEHESIRGDGSVFTARVKAFPLTGPDGASQGFIEVVEDISVPRQLEARYRQAQKLEAIGQLAGGVAHDFRNQLQVILGFGSMLLRRSLVKEEGRKIMEEVLKAAERSTAVTGQLLAFSRQETLRPRVQSVRDCIADMGKAMRPMVGEDIRVTVHATGDACEADIDTHLFQQAILNLASNARDAMPGGGTLAIETARVALGPESRLIDPDLAEGQYVVVTVRDTGAGMDEATQARAFDPFFTTKEVGKGTGLGLATVYGFVKQSGGAVSIRSEPGRGTTIRLYFPHALPPAPAAPAQPAEALPGGNETILIVEDEEAVRAMAACLLGEAGYRVLEAATAEEAISLAERSDDGIDILVTDIVMPGMNGTALGERLRARRPGMEVLYMSGYPGEELSRRGIANAQEVLIKPFNAEALLGKVRRALDARKKDRGN